MKNFKNFYAIYSNEFSFLYYLIPLYILFMIFLIVMFVFFYKQNMGLLKKQRKNLIKEIENGLNYIGVVNYKWKNEIIYETLIKVLWIMITDEVFFNRIVVKREYKKNSISFRELIYEEIKKYYKKDLVNDLRLFVK